MGERATLPKIFPRPHSLFLHGGFLKKSDARHQPACDDSSHHQPGNDGDCGGDNAAHHQPACGNGNGGEGSRFAAFRGIENVRADIATDPELADEEFAISIDAADGVKIRFGKAAERFAAETFSQIFEQATEAGLPCLTLRDYPDFPERGFMLDISRGRVPTMPELFALVKLLSRLRYNRLQLYTEHTFAFVGHEEVWRGASPMTPEEVRELDAFCRDNGIELVPNLNSFGHVERWLRHEKYRDLAECPDGFYHEAFKTHRQAGTFRACEETADFMGALYREFLPNFSSKIFNIGGDEPWELGLGRSREECERRGKKVVYLEHMERLRQRAEACGRRIMFWADVLLENDDHNAAHHQAESHHQPGEGDCCHHQPGDGGHHQPASDKACNGGDAHHHQPGFRHQPGEGDCCHHQPGDGGHHQPACDDAGLLSRLAECIPAIWGYEKGHPFDEQCRRVADCCRDFYVVPGTSAWLSFTGRLDNALANIAESVAAGFRHGARGVMLTTWGDAGYHNPFCANLFPMLACAAQSWNFLGNREPDLLGAFERFVGARELGVELFYFGRLDNFIAKKIANRSIIREFFFAKKSALAQLVAGVSRGEIVAASAECDRLLRELDKLRGAENSRDGGGATIVAEIGLSLGLSRLALLRAGALLRGDAELLAATEASMASPRLLRHFSEVWKMRDRTGGLDEALEYFRAAVV